MRRITESHVEEAALNWFEGLEWSVLHGPDIAPSANPTAMSSCKAASNPRSIR